MNQPLEIVSWGEAIVDFLPDGPGKKVRDVETFRKTSGGAPANAAVGLARLGHRCALVGMVGDDEFGIYLREKLASEGVDVSAVRTTDAVKTGITFISLDEHGDRSFLFFREPSAGMMITRDDVDTAIIEAAPVLITGTNLLTRQPVRDASIFVLETAKASGSVIGLDPNIRLHLWESEAQAREWIGRALPYATLLKVNEDEYEFLAGDQDPVEYFQTQAAPLGIKALVLTLAHQGARLVSAQHDLHVPAPPVDVTDTTGAGDGFLAGLFSGILRQVQNLDKATIHRFVEEADEASWRRSLELACWVGSKVCETFGATPALPYETQVPFDALGFERPQQR